MWNSRILPFDPRRRRRPARDAIRLERLLAMPDPELLASLANEDDRRRTQSRAQQRRRALTWLAGLATLALLVAAWGALRPAGESSRTVRARWLAQGGHEAFQAGAFAEAVATYQLATRLDPQRAAAWNGLGWSLYRDHQHPAARSAFERCVSLESEHPGAHRGLGNLAYAKGDYPRAAAHWRRVRTDRHLVAALLLAGGFEEAGQVLAPLRARSPQDALLIAMADAVSSRALDDELAWILSRGRLEASSDLARSRAWSRYYREHYAAATVAFEALLENDPTDTDAKTGLGFSLLGVEKVGAARLQFASLLVDNPGDAAARNGMALCALAEGNIDVAIATWEDLRQRVPGAQSPTQQLPFAYLERGDHEKALHGLLQLAGRHPDDPRVLEGLRQALTVAAR